MNKIVMRPTSLAAVAMGLPWLILSVVFAVAASTVERNLWFVSGICLAVFALMVFWVFSHRLEIKDGVLHYTSLFGPDVSIGISEIAAATTRVGPRKYSDRFLPTVRLEIAPTAESAATPFSINQKVFNRGDIRRLVETISNNGS